MPQTKLKNNRLDLIENFIRYNGDLRQIAKDLNQFQWDYEGQPAILDKQALQIVLRRYANGDLSVNDIYKWADFLELREDIDFAERDAEQLSEIMHALANPLLEGELTQERAKKWLSELL